MNSSGGPLGIFDSGVGGLTVVGSLLRRFPRERVLYVADQAHVPYGGRPLSEIKQFATGISAFLAGQGCRAVIMACNISSAVALESVREKLWPIPVFGMIEAAAERAAGIAGGAIGVLATAGTVKSGAYTARIRAYSPDARVTEVACPKLVPLVESGDTDSDEADDAATEYLAPLARADCGTIILGCTHYPFLIPALQAASAGLWVHPPIFIDPAVEMVDQARDSLELGSNHNGNHVFLTTGDQQAFERQAPVFLPGVVAEFGAAHWRADSLVRLESAVWTR